MSDDASKSNAMTAEDRAHRKKIIESRGTAAAAAAMVDRRGVEVEEASADINASAEAFIARFKNELRLQRLQSIENHKKMLARGL